MPMEDVAGFIKCVNCQKNFDEFQYDQILWLESCCHTLCRNCLKPLVLREWPERQKVNCPHPDCELSILDAEIRNALGSEVFDQLQKEATMKAVAMDEGLVSCACGTVMELV